MSSPLVVTRDPLLAAELNRLAAAAGVRPVVVAGVDVLAPWAAAPLVLLGADEVPMVAAAGVPARAEVYVVLTGAGDERLFRHAIACGAGGILELPEANDRLIELLAEASGPGRAPGVLLGVLAGSGGAGATVFATSLALRSAERAETVLIDADRYGAGVEHLLGPLAAGADWAGLARSTGRLGASAVRSSLPRSGDLAVLGWGAAARPVVPTPVARQVLAASVRAFGTAIVDLPRWPDQITEEALARCDLTVLVVAASVPGIAAAAQVVPRLPRDRSVLLVRGRGAGAEEIEGVLGLPVLHRMADQRGVEESIGLGLGPGRARRGPLARASTAVLDQVSR